MTLAVVSGVTCAERRSITDPEPGYDESLVVSDPATSVEAQTQTGRVAARYVSSASAAETRLSYVSLPPGSLPGGVAATIRNARTGGSASAFMSDGGFDPVGVEATAGDVLQFEIRTSDDTPPVLFERTVPAKRRPVVVRTNPPRGKRDVPLNATIIIVFSEPMDPTTLTSETVQLRARVGPARLGVPGRLEFRDANNLILAFLPAGSLRADVDFELMITTAARDADGDALEAPVTLQFTTARGNAQAANLIAFTSELHRSPGSEIYLVTPDGKDLRRLTYGQSWGSWDPSWSPDGERIAFASHRHHALRDQQDGRIYVMNADGSGVTRLTSDWGSGNDQSPAWSPDGARIAFARGECFAFDDVPTLSIKPERACVAEGGPAIYLMRADGSGATRLAEGSSPSWSPDGSKIAFVRWSGSGTTSAIYVMNDDGSGVTRLTTSPPLVFAPAWSLDGTRLAFAGGPDGETMPDLYVINADGSGLRRLTRDGGESPSWSPDGSKLAYAAGVPGTPTGISGPMGIFVTNADGRSPATYLGVEGYGPVWAPSGVVAPPRPLPTVSMSMQRAAGSNEDQQIDTVLAPLAEPLPVQVLRNGGPAQGVQVSWKIRGDLDGSSLSATTTTTDAAGVATVTLTLGSRARGYVVEASVAGAAGSPVVFGATARPGNPVAFAISEGNGQVGLPGRSLRHLYRVRVSDAHDNDVEGVSIDWAVAIGGGQIQTGLPRLDMRFASHLLGPEVGPQTVTARATAIPGAPQVTFSSAAGDAVVDVGTLDMGACLSGFEPSEITVAAGSTVAWGWIYCYNEGEDGEVSPVPHDLTFEDDPAEPVSSRVKNGGYHLRTFTAPGTYRYRCTLHSTSHTEGEVGTVRVQ